MKRILLFLFILCSFSAFAQPFNNEWIDYNKTYYKFKVGATGLYRIPQSLLTTISLQNTPVQNFQLWRNGKEIPLYTSVQSGTLGSSDYIEFWGEMNDGKPDKILFRVPDYQMSDKWSLSTDTAAFFLTVNPTGANKRLVPTANTIPGGTPTPDPYFIHTAGKYWRDRYAIGRAEIVGERVYSSSYDISEGFASGDIGNGATLTESMTNLFPYTGAGAPQPNFSISAASNHPMNPRRFRVKINGDSVLGREMNFYEYVKGNENFPVSLISSGNATIEITNQTQIPVADAMIVAQVEIAYPRLFNFGGSKNFLFKLAASGSGNYLEITNFNYGSQAPVLYDFTNGKRYVADIVSTPGVIKFGLPASATERELLLVNAETSNTIAVTSIQPRTLTNFALPANQGNYLIITNELLLTAANGSHPVDDYKAYRSSAAGGGFNTKIYLIDQLVDQFAFGIKMHPESIRNFLRWARSTYTSPVKNAFLIGRGVQYIHNRIQEANPLLNKLMFVPSFGYPASDNLLAAEPGINGTPKTPIGRLSVITPEEITVYLNKVKEYEQAQAFQSPLIKDKAWMKNIMHVIGGSEESLTNTLLAAMNGFKETAKDTSFGGNIVTFSKTSASTVESATTARIQSLFQEGLSIVTYFGHSSATVLEFNLENPLSYNNPGKYPLFILLGCNAGNFYNFSTQRLQVKETISENFVLTPNRGSIATVASTSLGVVHYLEILNSKNYNAIGRTSYNKSIGEQLIDAVTQVYSLPGGFEDFNARLHCEQSTLHGDPAIKVNSHPRPDYAIEDQLVKINPSFISVAESNFKVDAKFMNLGKAVNKDIVIELKRTYPDNSTEVVKRDTVRGTRYIDSLLYTIPIVPTRDKGLNKITITVDADNVVDELFETNNTITKEFYIFEDEARPVYPANFAIVNKQNIKLHVSTADPFAVTRQYMMEMDTTTFFNSSLKVTKTVTSAGGLISFDPGITYKDSTVYYWRTAPVPTSGPPAWNESSFIYLPNSDVGFNQSHFYQHTKSQLERMSLDSGSRLWKYNEVINNIFVRTGTWGSSSTQQANFATSLNGVANGNVCNWFSSLVFNVVHPVHFSAWGNVVKRNPDAEYPLGLGLYESVSPNVYNNTPLNFEYRYTDIGSRKKIMNFMKDTIPDGYYVVIRNFTLDPASNPSFPQAWANDWAADQSIYGTGQSLYHMLKNAGFSGIDSFYRARPWTLVYKKNDPSFTPKWIVGDGIYDNIALSVDCPSPDTLGYMTSPVFGRAKEWKQLKWRGSVAPPDVSLDDAPTIDVIGIRKNGTSNVLYTGLNVTQQDFDLSAVSASEYPYIQLKMRNSDSTFYTPYQMRYWRITYVPVPEGAVAPNVHFTESGDVDLGQPYNFNVAFKNISDGSFDSLKLKVSVTDKNNLATIIPVGRKRPLGLTPDTVQVAVSIPTQAFAGRNTLYLEVNPDEDQAEQYHFNNFLFRNFYVRPDTLNPLMDVTFDGVHILNRDIVSSKPDILVKLKDEAKWMVLNDTSLVELRVRYPSGETRRFFFNNDTLTFTPAGQAPNNDNTATIGFKPHFLADGDYELIVSGKDRSENSAGTVEYRVAFQVINKPMISNMLNYPNPFTTSTAFVFTITGSEVPQNIRIQIMTITGKIVRDITKEELGPLHIGRNITEFKWDGTDQYGQKLANGIYLYRVITNLNGKMLDKYKSDADNTDKYFNKGYGKMYLMR